MPSCKRLSNLCIFSRQSTSPSSPSSPSAPRPASFPITPPARLHLRSILPSSPQGMPTPPPPPREPYPWLWRCHSCYTVYRIGCTRRCLVCSHEYCVSTSSSRTHRSKKRRSNESCISEFDYKGWADWGAWRRKILGLESVEQQRDQAFIERKHNCLFDCDYPSECHHERYRLRTEAALEKERLMTLSPEERFPIIVSSTPSSLDDNLPLNEASDIREGEDEDDEPLSPTSPKSPLNGASFFWDEPDENEEETAWWVNSDGIEKKHKTKSQQKEQQPTEIELTELEGNNSATVDVVNVDSETLYSLLEVGEDRIPPDVVDYVASPRYELRTSNRKSPRHDQKLTVRNHTEADDLEDQGESSDSDSDSCSSLSCPSSTSSSDGEWVPTSDETSGSEGSSIADEDINNKALERELRAMIKAGKSLLRDES